ncbi:DUF5990 family protein [Occallatibacter savannae]|uniref:DUF5990 family protein n=1 Tax=Occallatibacter savannae TaxID=1002691 RepID=UPI000D69C0E1|nr:DUF5990 family protein [Occallatibacter savannae]
MERELTFRVVLEKPPAGVDFALQKGKGSQYEIVQKQRSKGNDLRFEFTARAVLDGEGDAPNLLGQFVQGQPESRFVYIGIGRFAGQTGTEWSRRLKVPLSGVSAEMVNEVGRRPNTILETHVPGTGKDGGPNCATVKPFAGWKLVTR